MNRRRFTFVDALRGLAALNVAVFHAVGGNHVSNLIATMPTWTLFALNHSNIGVAIFFPLSGFVIAHSLHSEELTITEAVRFMLKRSIRLDPPYWVAIAIAILFSIIASSMMNDRHRDDFTFGQIIAHIFYLQELLKIKEIGAVFWTLCLEFQFYLVFAIILLTRSRLVLVAAFIASLIWALGLNDPPNGLFVSLWYGFLLGTGAYLSWQHSAARPWFYIYVAIVLAGAIYLKDPFAMVACLTALALYFTARFDRLETWLNWQWVQFLGTISYSLYLIHNPITGATFRVGLILTGQSPLMEAIWWIVSFGVSIVAATLLYFFVERPSARLSKSFSTNDLPLPISSS